ncbi:YNL134C [Zygosaccharomyces parabailii]|nr:YNL134C [Zygosaccharomyces parabailii]
MSLPSHMKAVVNHGGQAVVINDVAIPPLAEGQVLIKTLAVAANPTDWKHLDYKLAPEGSITGCDVAGKIVKLGAHVQGFSEGDVVCGFVHGGSVKHPENGAFAEYSAMDSKLLYKFGHGGQVLSGKSELPEGPVTSLEGLVTFPISLNTAGIVLVRNLHLRLDWKVAAGPQRREPVLVWGGATAFGQAFIQLAKQLHAFEKIIVVASRKHEQLLKKYGADELFDYHDADVIEQIKKSYPELPLVIDGVSTPATYPQIYKATADSQPCTIVNLNYLGDKDVEKPKPNVKHESTMLYMMTGHEVPFGSTTFPPNPSYREDAIRFIQWAQSKIQAGLIHHMPVKIFHGLDQIPGMLEDIKTGKNSGVKLVATV